MKDHSVAFTSWYDGSDLPTMNASAHMLRIEKVNWIPLYNPDYISLKLKIKYQNNTVYATYERVSS